MISVLCDVNILHIPSISLVGVVRLQKYHLFRTDLNLALITQPNIFVTVGEALSVNFDEIFLAETPNFPSLLFEIVNNEGMLSGN